MELALLSAKLLLCLRLLLTFVAILLIPMVVVSLVVSVLQAAMQLTESSISFLPKLGAVVLSLLFGWQFISREMVSFSTELFQLAAAFN